MSGGMPCGSGPGEPEPEVEGNAWRPAPAEVSSPDVDPLNSSGALCATCSACAVCRSGGSPFGGSPLSHTMSTPAAARTLSWGDGGLPLARASRSDGAEQQPPSPELSRLTTKFEGAQKRNRGLTLQLQETAGDQRVFSYELDRADFSATWDDEQLHGAGCDWRNCLVSDPWWDHLSDGAKNRWRAREKGEDQQADAADLYEMSCLSITESLEERRAAGSSMGAFGKVLRAQWKGSIKVAVKTNRPGNVCCNADEIQLFIDLNHPHVVACYGILQETRDGGQLVSSIVTERCTVSLDAFLKNHSKWDKFHGEPLTADTRDFRKLTILEHVSQGLQGLHDLSVLHRDIKSLNILLDGEAGTLTPP